MRNQIFIVFLIFILLVKCKENHKDEIAVLHKEVMEIHDSVMPRMGEIHTLKSKLKETLQPNVDSTQTFNMLKQLSDADDAMMSWMSEYKEPDEQSPIDEMRNFYALEKKKIIEVKKIMEDAIHNCESFIKQKSVK